MSSVCPMLSVVHAFIQVQPNGFHFRVVLDGVRAQLAAEAGALIAAKRQGRVHQAVGIDPHRSGFQPPRDEWAFFTSRVHTADARPYGF